MDENTPNLGFEQRAVVRQLIYFPGHNDEEYAQNMYLLICISSTKLIMVHTTKQYTHIVTIK